jgi:hypothetical protein
VEKITAKLTGATTPAGTTPPAVPSTVSVTPPTSGVDGTDTPGTEGTDGTDTPGTDGTDVLGTEGTDGSDGVFVSGTDGTDGTVGAEGTDTPGTDGTATGMSTATPMGAAEERVANARVANREREVKEGIVVRKERGGSVGRRKIVG